MISSTWETSRVEGSFFGAVVAYCFLTNFASSFSLSFALIFGGTRIGCPPEDSLRGRFVELHARIVKCCFS